MRIDFRRLFFVTGVMWILIMWALLAVYGSIQLWDRHVVKWFNGGTAPEVFALSILGLSVFWILFIIKTLKDEFDEQDKQPLDRGNEHYERMPLRNPSGS